MSEVISVGKGDALIVVDVQNDFLPGGALAVADGDKVIAPLNRYIKLFSKRGLPIVATRDWHPPDHASFKAQGGPWPPHCVQGTAGAAFAAALSLPPDVPVVSKGMAPDDDDYSNFSKTDLDATLKAKSVRRLFVGGLATDYCVRDTVMDALERGYHVWVLSDGIRAVNVNPDDGHRAEDDMKKRGARVVTWKDFAL